MAKRTVCRLILFFSIAVITGWVRHHPASGRSQVVETQGLIALEMLRDGI